MFGSFDGYDRRWLRGDLVAGLTVWAVLVPEALAYATIAGVSPVVGLYAAPPALLLYAVFGSSRHLVVGPMSATAALSAAAVADLVTNRQEDFAAFTATLALVTGVIALLAGLLRLGFMANFISEPVLKGFIIGLALTIIIGQVPKLFGIEKDGENFFEQLWNVVKHLADADGRTTLIGVLTLAVVLGLRRFAPIVPASLVAVVLGVIAVKVFDLADKGVDIVGDIKSGLPSVGLPDGLDPDDYFATAASAVGIMLVGFAEGLGAAKTYASRAHYEVDANRELLGLGAANLGAGLCSGMVVNGSLSKTAVNGSAGARSQFSGIAVAALTVITLLFLTSLFEDLPEATLAAVVIAAVIELVDIPALLELYRLHTSRLGRIYGRAARADFIAAVAALLGVLIFDTLPGLFIGIAVSLLLLLYRASRPNVAELGAVPGTPGLFADRRRHPEYPVADGIHILRIEGGLFFANADAAREMIKEHVDPETRAVVIDAQTIAFVDVTAVRMLDVLAGDLARESVVLAIAHDIGQVRDMLSEGEVTETLRVFPTIDAAVADLRQLPRTTDNGQSPT